MIPKDVNEWTKQRLGIGIVGGGIYVALAWPAWMLLILPLVIIGLGVWLDS